MRFETVNGVTLVRSDLFDSFPEIQFACSTRHGGVSQPPFDSLNISRKVNDHPDHVEENRRRFLEAVGTTDSRLAIPKQIHSKNVATVEKPGDYPDTDALITDQKNIFLVIGVADCVPMLFYEPGKKILGAAHAGWRGASQNIVGETVRAMVSRFQILPENLFVFIGPSIGPCCYEVGEEVAEHFDVRYRKDRKGQNPKLDLWGITAGQLLEHQLKQEHIELADHCTSCHFDDFFSHRAGKGKTGRMWATIGRTR